MSAGAVAHLGDVLVVLRGARAHLGDVLVVLRGALAHLGYVLVVLRGARALQLAVAPLDEAPGLAIDAVVVDAGLGRKADALRRTAQRLARKVVKPLQQAEQANQAIDTTVVCTSAY